jgi:regulator of sigma E protease
MIIIYVIIGLSLLILVHELGHFFVAKMFGIRVDEFGFGYPPRLFSKKYGETEYSINALPFGGFVKIYGEDETKVNASSSDFKRSFAYQSWLKRSAVLLAGVFMNIVLAFVLLSLVFMVGAPKYMGVASVADGSPAEEAGLEGGDIILEASVGEDLLSSPISTDKFIEFVNNHKGENINLTIQRDNETFKEELLARKNPPAGEGSIGIALVDMGIEKQGFFGAIWQGMKTTGQLLKGIAIGFYNIITGIFTNPDIVENIAGPVGIFVITKQAGSIGLIYLVQLIAIISLNLVIINLLPFPALDGGRFLFILIEKIKGSPVSNKFQMAANAFGFILLILLMIIVTIKDIGNFIL